MQLTFGSVCSGIEAASVAWDPLGWRAVWLAEVDKAASEVLAHRFPAVPNLGDMTLLAEMIRRREIPAPDLLVGGTPCQAFSVAGRRQGLADERGALTLAYIDLANAIDEVRAEDCQSPVVIVWENVPGVLSSKDNAFGCFLAGLAAEDQPLVAAGKRWSNAGCVLGPERAIAWRIIDAQYVGLAQRRRRVFVVASAGAGFDPAAILLEFDGVRRDSAPSRSAGQGFAHPVAPCLTSSGRGVERVGDIRGQDPVVAVCGGNRGTTGLTFAKDVCPTLRAGGNATGGDRPPGTDADTADPLLVYEPVPTWWDGRDVSQTLDAVLHKGQTMPEKNRFPAVLQPIPFDTTQITSPSNYSQPRPGDPCHHLAAGAHPPAIAFSSKDYGGDSSSEVSPTLRSMNHAGSHANGGGQVAVAYQDEVCVTGTVTHTLKAEGFDASEDGTGRGQPIVPCGFQSSQSGTRINDTAGTLDANYGARRHNGVLYPAMAVRRLMPVECERLQGFPDGWTDVPTGPKRKPAADGPRYKQLGNSMPVNVMRWIGGRIDDWLEGNAAPIGHNLTNFDELLG